MNWSRAAGESTVRPARNEPPCSLLTLVSTLLGGRSQPARSRLGPGSAAGVGGTLLVWLALALLFSPPAQAGPRFDAVPPAARVYLPAPYAPVTGAPVVTSRTYLPLLSNHFALEGGCPTSSTVQWGAMQPSQSLISGAAQSPDLNMNVRGWYTVEEFLGLVLYSGPPDLSHPLHLSSVAGSDAGSFTSTYQVNDWDWEGCNCAVPRPRLPYPVTMLGLATIPGQPLHIASRDLPIDPRGFVAMVVYADERQLALKYTSEDRVDTGYLIHLSNLCSDPNLVALYEQLDSAGRHWLPGVYNDSVVAVALEGEVRVSLRDSGSFLDPRSWKDWWQDQPPPATGLGSR